MCGIHPCITGHTADQQSYSFWVIGNISPSIAVMGTTTVLFFLKIVRKTRYKHEVLDTYPQEDLMMWYLGICMAANFRSWLLF